MQGVSWMVLFACGQLFAAPPGDDVRGQEALALATRMVDEIGPRVTASPGSRAALQWVEERLEERHWPSSRWVGARRDGAGDGVLACGGAGPVVLYFAHVDTVHPDVPGANDNAAAVGALLELASRLGPATELRTVPGQRRRVCLAFPDGEEIGLVGSRSLRDDGRLEDVDQVVALDLVGRGQVTHNGLGPAWTASDARALLSAAPADVPWLYRAISHALPEMERSDHGPWGREGVRASHVLARAESGVYWAYHSSADTPDQLDPQTLGNVVEVLESIARMAPLPPRGADPVPAEPWFVVPWTARWGGGLGGPWVASGTVTLVGLCAGGLLGVLAPLLGRRETSADSPRDWRAWFRALAVDGGRIAAPLVAGVVAMGLASLGRTFHADRALPVALATWGAALSVLWAIEPWTHRMVPLFVGVVGAIGIALLATAAPLLALPGAVALGAMGVSVAARARGWSTLMVSGAVVATWPAAYLVRPMAIREVAFHHLAPAHVVVWAPAWMLLAVPAVVAWLPVFPARRRIAFGFAVLAGLAAVWAWACADATGVFDVPPMQFPPSWRR